MLLSETTGTPFGKRAACSFCVVPADMSVTVPLIVRDLPNSTDRSGAVMVVCEGPLPKQ